MKWFWQKDEELATKVYKSVDDMFAELNKESKTLWYKITYPFHRAWYNFKDIPYRLRCRCYYQHHLVKMPKLSKWSWCDTDYRILHANMELVCQFIDNEKPFDRIEWNSDDGHQNAYDTMYQVYTWWKNYPNRTKEYDDALSAWADHDRKNKADKQELWDKLNKLELDLDNETKVMLHKIIDIKDYLWT